MDIVLVSTVLSAAVLLSASVQDVRRREVDDAHWWFLLFVSSACLVASPQGGEFRTDVLLAVLSSVSFYVAVVSEGRIVIFSVLAGAVLWGSAVSIGHVDSVLTPCLLTCFFEAAIVVLYVTGVLRGGADVKCLLAIAVGHPFYYGDSPGLIGTVLPPVVAVLFEAALMTLVLGGIWLIWLSRGRHLSDLPKVRMPLEEVSSDHVWLCEDVRGGEVVGRSVPEEEKDEAVRRIREVGGEDALVSPMFPFIVPIAAAFIMVSIAGCPFLTL